MISEKKKKMCFTCKKKFDLNNLQKLIYDLEISFLALLLSKAKKNNPKMCYYTPLIMVNQFLKINLKIIEFRLTK